MAAVKGREKLFNQQGIGKTINYPQAFMVASQSHLKKKEKRKGIKRYEGAVTEQTVGTAL